MSIQVYWILNSYHQKKEAFQRDVYSAMEYVSKKMQEQENIKTLHQSIVVEKEETVLLSSSTNMIRIYTKSELKKEQSPDSVRNSSKPIFHKKVRTISDTNFIQDTKIFKLNIDSNLKPKSFVLDDMYSVEISTEVNEVKGKSVNVGGIVKATNNKFPGEYLVIGAHFDHLGWGGQNSLYMGEPSIHNGADDNASGTTGLLELAEKFSSIKDKIDRDIVFIAFSGEELGLLGSSYVVNNFPLPIENDITMINMDMIGRLNDKKDLIVYGTGTSSKWKNILDDKNEYDFNLTFNDEGFGPSDHSSFYGKKIPVLFFFTGTHTDYHKPSDDADKINAAGQEKVVNYVYDVALAIVNSETKPDYISVEKKDTGRMMGSRVYVGTVPDFAGEVQ